MNRHIDTYLEELARRYDLSNTILKDIEIAMARYAEDSNWDSSVREEATEIAAEASDT